MKMLLIIFRSSLEDELCRLLNKLGVTAYTEVTKVGGKGETGAALNTLTWPGGNTMILAALTEDHADRVVEGVRVFRDESAQQRSASQVPLRVFALPCVQEV